MPAGWWDAFIGPGRAIDTDRFAVLCVNYLGGCYGSTGPASLDPTTGRHRVEPGGDLRRHSRQPGAVARPPGIDRLHAGGGRSAAMSQSGHPVPAALDRHPDSRRAADHALQRLHNFEQKVAILHDPDFAGGDFYEGPSPDRGLALARMIGHKTFVSLSAIEERPEGR